MLAIPLRYDINTIQGMQTSMTNRLQKSWRIQNIHYKKIKINYHARADK